MSNLHNVRLSLQSLPEWKVQEIFNDGRETFIKPLSLSESLTDLANQIDFLNVEDSSAQENEESVQENSFKVWEGIRRHLQQALIEMTVLVDVLSIAQNKPPIGAPKDSAAENPDAHRYLMFDTALKDSEPFKPSFQMVTKKKSLSATAKILTSSAKRLETAWSEASSQVDFHSELLRVRKSWRLRRVGEKIIGDLSYGTAGSDFANHGAFEVIKKSLQDDEDEDSSTTSTSVLSSPIRVKVGSDLRGHASILISIVQLQNENKQSSGDTCSLTYFDMVQKSLSKSSEPLWQRKLCNAQNVLFCREIFMLLTKEAIQYKTRGMVAPFIVVGDVISTLLFPDTKLIVKFMHSKKVKQSNSTQGDSSEFFSLKLAVLQLLQAHHSRRLNVPPPKPVAAVLGLKDTVRRAAVQAWPGAQLTAFYQQEGQSLAESLLKMSKHYVIHQRLNDVIATVTQQFDDPAIQSHWSMVCSLYESNVRVTISNCCFEACYRTYIQFTAMPNEVKAIQRDGTVAYLSIEKTSLYNFFISLICTHQLLSVQTLARAIGWTVLQHSPHSSVGICSSLMSRGTLLVATPSGNNAVSVICSIDMNGKLSYEVNVQFAKLPGKYEASSKFGSAIALEQVKSSTIRSEWHAIDWSSCNGKHFIEKMETILTYIIGC